MPIKLYANKFLCLQIGIINKIYRATAATKL